MSRDEPPPAWRLPEGVNAALWAYAHDEALASTEDAYFANHALLAHDLAYVAERFREPGPLIDLGSGAGRAAAFFARQGFEVTAVDLSHAMLREARRKAHEDGTAIRCVQANLCRLGCFPDASFDYALSLFSTLGMVRGAAARRRALLETARLLRPNGRLALHAHNLWLNLRLPQGRRWLLGQVPGLLTRAPGAADRRMTYRGVPNMEVHLYRWGELKRDLTAAGLRIDEALPLCPITARVIGSPRLAPWLRAGGWIVFASKR